MSLSLSLYIYIYIYVYAKVIGITSTREKADRLLEYGCDAAIAYKTEDMISFIIVIIICSCVLLLLLIVVVVVVVVIVVVVVVVPNGLVCGLWAKLTFSKNIINALQTL